MGTNDDKVRLYTYTIYNEDGSEAEIIELRHCYGAARNGIRLWITTEDNTIEIKNDISYFQMHESKSNFSIKESTWNIYFDGEKRAVVGLLDEITSIPLISSQVVARFLKV